jgi:hypothetical protein
MWNPISLLAKTGFHASNQRPPWLSEFGLCEEDSARGQTLFSCPRIIS